MPAFAVPILFRAVKQFSFDTRTKHDIGGTNGLEAGRLMGLEVHDPGIGVE